MINVAILGFGTVGSGVADVLSMNRELIRQRAGKEVALKYVLDVRDFPDSPYKNCFVKDFSVIENDPDVNIVVATIGGATVALDVTRESGSYNAHGEYPPRPCRRQECGVLQ